MIRILCVGTPMYEPKNIYSFFFLYNTAKQN